MDASCTYASYTDMRGFKISPICHAQKSNISPHDRSVSTGTACVPLTNIRYDPIHTIFSFSKEFLTQAKKLVCLQIWTVWKPFSQKVEWFPLRNFGRKNAKETAGVDNGEVLDNSVGAGGALQCITLHWTTIQYSSLQWITLQCITFPWITLQWII